MNRILMPRPKQSVSRRDMLKLAAVGAAALAAPVSVLSRESAKRIPISLQLYSVRNDCAKDLDAALEQVAKMGFDGVEFAGYHKYGGNPAGLRKRLDDLGLKVAATHIGLGQLVGDNLNKTIEFHKTIGCKYLIVPGDGAFCDPEKSIPMAEKFTKAAEMLKPHDMYCGYHNHTREFSKQGDKTYWDLFAERTPADVVLQQDVGWSTHAGQDPVALIERYPGRTKVVHFKPDAEKNDPGKQPIIGKDSVKWRGIIDACYTVGGTEWFTVEQEWYPQGMSPMDASEQSFIGLKAILKEMGH